MDLFVLAVLLFVSLYFLFHLLKVISIINPRRKKVVAMELPPGSTGWPIIGETLDYLRTAKEGTPEKFIEDRRNKYPPSCKVFKTSLLLEPMAVLCTAAGNKFLFSNENKLVRTWWPTNFKKIFPTSNKTEFDQETIRLRRVLLPFLKPDALRSYVEVIDELTKQHLDLYWSSSSLSSVHKRNDGNDQRAIIKVYPLVKKYTLRSACKLFLDIEDAAVVAKLEESYLHVSSGFISWPINFPGTKFNGAIKASKKIRKEMEKIVKTKRHHLNLKTSTTSNHAETGKNHQDLLSRLLMESYRDGEVLKDSDIASILFALILGGFDTISTTLVSIMKFLSQFPHVYDAVLKEQMEIAGSKEQGELLNWDDLQKMKYSWSVACEALRLCPPFLGFFREAITDFVYEGYLIPRGMKLHWNLFATHKNPEYFPDPEKFDPSRFVGHGPVPYSYVPFGGGSRMCPGPEYARLKILVFIHNVVTRYKWEMVFPDEKLVMDLILVATKGLPIRLFPHSSSPPPRPPPPPPPSPSSILIHRSDINS